MGRCYIDRSWGKYTENSRDLLRVTVLTLGDYIKNDVFRYCLNSDIKGVRENNDFPCERYSI